MKLFLCVIDDRRWQGLVDIDGETFKINLFPGSAVKDWEAVLEVGGWVDLTPNSQIVRAVERAKQGWDEFTIPVKQTQEEIILRAIQEQPQLMDEILKAISGKEEPDDSRTV